MNLENLEFKNNNDFILMFEKRLSEFTGAPYVVLTNGCTNALFLTLALFKQKRELPEFLEIPKRTYVSIPQMLITNGIIPKYMDVSWFGNYQIGKLPIWDCAVGFKPHMYISGQYQCLSFQQKKALPIGKGGAILLDNYEDYKLLKRMSHDGRDGSITTEQDLENITLGYHMYMSPDEAAKGILLLNQLKPNKVTVGNYMDYPDVSSIGYNSFLKVEVPES